MSGEAKTIGICLAQAHTYLKTDLISEMDRAAARRGYRVIAFNSLLDYYWSQNGSHPTACVYDLVRFDRLSALVILHDNLYNLPAMKRMIERAHGQGIPVFYLGGEREDCVSVVDEYEDAYKALIRHVIREHGVRDTFYIAGLRDEDNSVRRLRYYREVLEECGIPWREEDTAYGEYLESMAADIALRLIEGPRPLPRAIMCANDSMASAVCDTLIAHGIRIPGDVVVTGFDGTPTAYLVHPQISTCNSNTGELADLVADLTARFHAGEPLEKLYFHPYKTVLMESCGCPAFHHPRFNALHTFRQAEAFVNHENTMYYAIEQLLEMREQLEILRKLSSILLPDSALYVNRSFLEADPAAEYAATAVEDDLIMIPYRKPGSELIFQKVYRQDMPLPNDGPTGATLINVVHSDKLVFGYYAAHTEDMNADAQLIKRLSDVLNLIFAILCDRRRQDQLLFKLENNLYVDPSTGMMNLRGLTRWFTGYTLNSDNQGKTLAFSVYAMPHYSYLFETYGLEEVERASGIVALALENANPQALQLARLNEEQFAVLYVADAPDAISGAIDTSVAAFFRQIERYNAVESRPYYLEVNCGCTLMEIGPEQASLENLIRLALGEMYLNRLRDKSRDEVAKSKLPSELYSAFSLLMEKNLFRFVFQPIINARTGKISAYEALMRTDEPVRLNPLEILSTAREYNRLYEVERATVFGIIEHYARNIDAFHGAQLFINSIPGHFLDPGDCDALLDRYGACMDRLVLELTEDEPATDEELDRMKRLCRPGSAMQIAIDDFGTGHSNIVNLLRYAPQIIKIDRALVTGIESDNNRRLFVRNTVDFAHQNGILALAEGVETPEELKTVIDIGIDLIQGYYTGRPAPQPLGEIDPRVRAEIVRENLRLLRGSEGDASRTLADGDRVDIVTLGLEGITCLRAGEGRFALTGSREQWLDMQLQISDDAEATVVLRDVRLRRLSDATITLGRGSRVTLILEGENALDLEGILVPPTASLELRGAGSLAITNTRNDSAGIGGRYDAPFGDILIALDGSLRVEASGDHAVCLGGGSSAGSGIRIARGTCALSASGINALCLGAYQGDVDIDIGQAELSLEGRGNSALLMGSVVGRTDIRSEGRLRLRAACDQVAGIGTVDGAARVSLCGGSVEIAFNCNTGVLVGALGGRCATTCRDTRVHVHGEGNRVVGFGSLSGECDTRFESGDIGGELSAGEQRMLGNERSRCVITGGNFHLSIDDSPAPVSPGGMPLTLLNPAGDRFEATFADPTGTWIYRAERNADGVLGVFVPKA